MTTLYLVQANLSLLPERRDQLLALLGAGDSVLFTGAGLYGAGRLPLPPDVRGYVLEADVEANGLRPPAPLEQTDYAGMVRLCETHERCISW